MSNLKVFTIDDGIISKHEAVVTATTQPEEETFLKFEDETEETVSGTIFGAKPAPKVWINPVYKGPVEHYENIRYLMTHPANILLDCEDGRRYYSGGTILRVAVE